MEKQLSLFSVIIPVFNGASTIQTTIESILSQVFNNFEILLIDGASTDKTLDVIQRLSSKDARIKWISEKDKGVYDAMNKGVAMAKGDWLYFIGSDDYLIDENVLLNLGASIEKYPKADFIYGNVTSPYLGDKYAGPFDQMRMTRQNICHQSIFYRRTVFDLLGNFNSKYKVNSDWDFNLRCFFHPKITTHYIDLIIAYFSGGGLSNTVEDPAFSEDRSAIIAHNGYHSIPLRKLKAFCKSNLEYVYLLIKRVFYRLGFRF